MSNLNNDGLFKQVLQAQETQREGWTPDPVAELNQRLIDRQESFQMQLVRIEDTWREKLRDSVAETNIYINQVTEAVRQVEASDALNSNLLVDNRAKDAEIDRLKKELGEAKNTIVNVRRERGARVLELKVQIKSLQDDCNRFIADCERAEKERDEARKDAERLYLSIKEVDDLPYHELDIMNQHEALTGKPLSFG